MAGRGRRNAGRKGRAAGECVYNKIREEKVKEVGKSEEWVLKQRE